MNKKKKTFLEELQDAKAGRYAVGAFNIFNYLSADAVVKAAAELDVPVILQTSVVTVKEFGPEKLGSMLRLIADQAPVNVLIHLDHCQDIELAKACVDAGWDSVMYDGSRLSLEDNIAGCREVVKYAHSKGVDVEGEFGRIVGVEDAVKVSAEDASLAGLEDSIRFVRESGIDAYARRGAENSGRCARRDPWRYGSVRGYFPQADPKRRSQGQRLDRDQTRLSRHLQGVFFRISGQTRSHWLRPLSRQGNYGHCPRPYGNLHKHR